MVNEAELLEQLEIYYNLWRESMVMYEEWSARHGLTYNSVMVLSSLAEDRDGCTQCTQKKIAQKWLLPKQTVNTILKELERRGLAELTPLPSDKRNKLVRLTAEGERYAGSIVCELRELELYVMTNLGLQRARSINRDLARFVELFREGGGLNT